MVSLFDRDARNARGVPDAWCRQLVAFGALLLIGIMIGAIITHLFVIGGTAVPALVLLALSAIVAYAKRGQIASLTKIVVRLLRCAFPAAN